MSQNRRFARRCTLSRGTGSVCAPPSCRTSSQSQASESRACRCWSRGEYVTRWLATAAPSLTFQSASDRGTRTNWANSKCSGRTGPCDRRGDRWLGSPDSPEASFPSTVAPSMRRTGPCLRRRGTFRMGRMRRSQCSVHTSCLGTASTCWRSSRRVGICRWRIPCRPRRQARSGPP